MFVGEKGAFPKNIEVPGSMLFGVWSANDDISIESEELVYPWTSLVAEIGGTLGLFVGFSFIMVWDGVEMVWQWRNILEKWCKQSRKQGGSAGMSSRPYCKITSNTIRSERELRLD